MSIQINVRIKDPLIWEKFKKFVLKKHGKLHTALGKELTKAIKFYLEAMEEDVYTHTHIQLHANIHELIFDPPSEPKPNSRTIKTLQRLIRRLAENNYTQEIPEDLLERFIVEEAGGDRRTLRKYKRYLFTFGFIKRARQIKHSRKWILQVNLPMEYKPILKEA